MSVDERRKHVLVGELPPDFLRLIVPSGEPNSQQPVTQEQVVYGFVPPNTRGRVFVTIVDATLVRNYGLVRMDPYCRLRVGRAVFETHTKLSGGRNPVWNRTVHAYLPNGVESIFVQIYDEKAFSVDECIAWAHIILPPAIFHGETIDEYYPLTGQQGEGKEGMIHLVISFASVEAQIPAVTPSNAPLPVVITTEDTKELESMFPTVDKEVIRCILEESRGDKEATVGVLLEMTKAE